MCTWPLPSRKCCAFLEKNLSGGAQIGLPDGRLIERFKRRARRSALEPRSYDDCASSRPRYEYSCFCPLKPHGLQRAILSLALAKPARLYVSDAVLSEYREVLGRPEFKIRKGIRLQFMQLIKDRARLVKATPIVRAAKDPSDDKFLECGDAARADYLITGNLRHFPRFWKSTKVVTAREFMGIVAPHFGGNTGQSALAPLG